MDHIVPEKDLWDSLLRVAKPGRYTGGEFGITCKDDDTVLHIGLSYPDLYEIGMSNHAVKILYSLFNSIPGIFCERVFAPAPDFEKELRQKKIPLYSLESGRPLKNFDIICFSIGYELTATNVLAILELGGISIYNADRGINDPVVIAGGPAVTNPLPFSSFIDCFFIGEAEGKIEKICTGLSHVKLRGGTRKDILEYIQKEPSIWSKNKQGHKAVKNTWMEFSQRFINPPFPVSNIKIVQDQGVTEIMRGCPHNCRFCHASIYYRPFRYKKPLLICSEIEQLILECGYRTITLSSLSSGDYKHIDMLLKILSERYKHVGVSFALPSLRIDSLSLSLLKDISSVRKSGLTFAVETPLGEWQAGLNKNVPLEKTIALLHEAKKMGWKSAKFYFMIGLPLYEEDESDAIINFLKEVQNRTKMQLNVNISTFIPKPHTPFQWASQLSEEESLKRILYIKKSLNGKKFKINYHSPFASLLEGMIARGTEKIGTVIYHAYKKGARLDAWDDYLQKDLWRDALHNAETSLIADTLGPRKSDEVFPWDSVYLGVTKKFLKDEWVKAANRERTEACSSCCSHNCGTCGEELKVEDTITKEEIITLKSLLPFSINESKHAKLIFSYSKMEKASFLSHLNCMKIFERSFLRAGYLLSFTKGFNPKPVIEFASPLALGLESKDEVFSCEINNFDTIEEIIKKMNKVLPVGFELVKGKKLLPYKQGTKKISLAQRYWGSDMFLKTENQIGKIIHIFSQLNDIGDELNELHDFSPALDSFFMLGNGLCVRWKKMEKKGYNILHFLQKLTGRMFFELGIKITRMNTLAMGKDGQPEHFFDVM